MVAADLPVPRAEDRRPRADLAAMAAGAALLSCTSIFVVLAQVAPTVSAFYRMAFGGVALLGWVALRGRWQRIRWGDVVLALLPAIGFATDLIFWHRSILWVGPGVATLLTNFQVFLLALVGWVAYRERLGRAFMPGMVLALAGLWLLVGAHWSMFDARHRLGVWFGLASCLAYAVYLLSFRRALSGRTPLSAAQFLGLMSVLCAGLLGGWCIGAGETLALVTWRSWGALLALGFFGQVVAWLLMVRAMPRLPASQVGLLLLLQPALAFVLDVLLFGRATTLSDWLGLGLALAGILLGTLRPRRPVAGAAAITAGDDA
ncbi:DMT family transporter [Dyella sp.]|jgi:drug/metabolite transporter (DMT)-like permease|uniref:DMT family transporter n=1 Tax=Dyella sp. TaxID=1869338 RepID=UPI002D767549|nr:DMT family transporter [Dyella sp.]HET6430944.1 DMT family transporter [Dyella sp.]